MQAENITAWVYPKRDNSGGSVQLLCGIRKTRNDLSANHYDDEKMKSSSNSGQYGEEKQNQKRNESPLRQAMLDLFF